jgi:hypothetical protein
MSDAKIVTTEGDTYITDVYIDSESWLVSVTDREIEPSNDSDEFIFASDEAEVASLLAKTKGEPYVRVGSGADNTYNHENNFAEQILFSLWVPQSMIDDHWSSNGGVNSADWLECDGLGPAISTEVEMSGATTATSASSRWTALATLHSSTGMSAGSSKTKTATHWIPTASTRRATPVAPCMKSPCNSENVGLGVKASSTSTATPEWWLRHTSTYDGANSPPREALPCVVGLPKGDNSVPCVLLCRVRCGSR